MTELSFTGPARAAALHLINGTSLATLTEWDGSGPWPIKKQDDGTRLRLVINDGEWAWSSGEETLLWLLATLAHGTFMPLGLDDDLDSLDADTRRVAYEAIRLAAEPTTGGAA